LSILTLPDPTYNISDPDTPSGTFLPIHCTDDEEAWTLGRSFLQNYYLRTDLSLPEAEFTIHQVKHTSGIELVPVEAGGATNWDLDLPVPRKATLSKGAIIGISVGGAVLLLLVI